MPFRRWWLGLAATAFVLLAFRVPVARADNSLNSSEHNDPKSGKLPPVEGANEFTLVPGIGGSTDVGVGGGFFATWTRTEAGVAPYLWNIEAAWVTTLKFENGNVLVPLNDGYAKLTINRFLGAPLRFDLRPSFTDELVLYYYGMGNAAGATAPAGQSNQYFTYGRVHPSVFLDLASRIRDHLAGTLMLRYTASELDIPQGTKLASDIQNASPEVRKLIGPTQGLQSVALLGYGLQFDTRDNEVSPHSGTWDDASASVSPGGAVGDFPFRYMEFSGALRAYVPIGRRVTLAMRVAGDVLLGNPPFAELTRWGDNYGIGGQNTVRGVPAQRYYGKVKVLGNFEVRGRLFDFRLLGKTLTLGSAAFADAGRVWADTTPQPELDGTGWGIKYGLGGGLRLLSGSAFALRADVAWSPDASPVSVYVCAGEIF